MNYHYVNSTRHILQEFSSFEITRVIRLNAVVLNCLKLKKLQCTDTKYFLNDVLIFTFHIFYFLNVFQLESTVKLGDLI